MKTTTVLLWVTLLVPASGWSGDCPDWTHDEAIENIKRLASEVAQHDERYFHQNAPGISDNEYDALTDRLKQWETCFGSVQINKSSAGSHRAKIPHRAVMGSLKKASTIEDVDNFLQALPGNEMLVQPKIDGVAVELVYCYGQLVQATTRGDGKSGVDITHHIKHMPLIPATLAGYADQEVILHGELFARLDRTDPDVLKRYASARHLVAGQLNRSKPDSDVLGTFDFFPWLWIDSPYASDHQSIKALAQMGFPLPLKHTHVVHSPDQVVQLSTNYFADHNFPFLMDGIVIKVASSKFRTQLGWSGNAPGWAIAWKFSGQSALSEVVKIAFTIGRTGRITPVVHINPVHIGNRIISRISLGSVAKLKQVDLAAGDLISVSLKGHATPVFGQVLFRPQNRVHPDYPENSH